MSHDRDLASTLPWARSLRASRKRRDAAASKRRWSTRRRATATAMTVAVLGLGGVAAAQTGSAGGSAKSQAGGASIAAVQGKLGIAADGVVGPQTRAAVKRFQRQAGIAVDGVIGPQTLAALGLRGGATASARSSRTTSGSAGSGSGSGTTNATLRKIAQCESGGDPTAISANGTYRGKYQFDRQTWRANGGSGDPAAASEAEQDRIAAKLLAARGTQPWPVCGR
ncbi:transglycosylase family protein [Patulibacter defluvii]|uniref:transglycosylase family protein n=1 Tax=Patulibacter defluvii TaxID=3095358 RepID=UPI002A748C02|nr:transglycosylase family protein [Patulibacter sp. DM4]